jgi:hypothetical protein
MLGACGADIGVAELEAEDAGLLPATFIALTV